MSHKVIRQRTTWGRNAAEAPALPGRELETKVWPAAEGDHDESLYENGSFESWAELPVPGPYPKGEAPADPGTEEEGMHPAARRAGGDKSRRGAEEEARNIQRRSARCVRAAEAWLGRRANEAEVERLAEKLMDNPARLAQLEDIVGGPTACPDVADVPVDIDAPVVDEGFGGMPDAYDDVEIVSMRDKMASLERSFDSVSRRLAEIASKISPNKAASANKGRAVMASIFENVIKTASGKPGGKIRLADWKGPRSVFALLDQDRDGIITTSDLLAAWGYGPARAADADRAAGDDEENEAEGDGGGEDEGKTASKPVGKRRAELPPEFLEQQEKKKDEAKDKDDDDDGKKASAKKPKAARVVEAADDDEDAGDEQIPTDEEAEDAKKAAALKAKRAAEKVAADKKAAAEKKAAADKLAAAKAAKAKAAKSVEAEDEESEDEGSEDEEGKTAAKAAAKKAPKKASRTADDEESEEAPAEDADDEEGKTAAEDDSGDDMGDDDFDKSAADIDNDPMGLAGAGDFEITAEEQQALNTLYGPGDAGAGQVKQASNLNLRPQPKKPTRGIQSARVASGQARKADGGSNIPQDLNGIWGAPPNVAGHFRTGG